MYRESNLKRRTIPLHGAQEKSLIEKIIDLMAIKFRISINYSLPPFVKEKEKENKQ